VYLQIATTIHEWVCFLKKNPEEKLEENTGRKMKKMI